DLKPGDRLPEPQLASRLGVSRTPIREAIRILEAEGLVTMVARRGAQVAQIDEKSLRDVMEVRRALDVLSVELACERISQSELVTLRAACEAFEDAVKTKELHKIAQADVDFHETIVKASGNPRLLQLVNHLSLQVYRYRYEHIKEYEQHARLIQEHRVMYDSIVKKDKETAGNAASNHIDNQENVIREQIRLDDAYKADNFWK
ncbi:MAG: GntR family transcriptional regulator, partial [Clostridium sp.]|nr:GntR family transcriptional regulator [Clostridium sp.]